MGSFRGRNRRGGNGSGSGLLFGTGTSVFADNAARDTYFTANADQLTQYDNNEFLLIQVGTGFQRRRSNAWITATNIVRGPKGDTPTNAALNALITPIVNSVVTSGDYQTEAEVTAAITAALATYITTSDAHSAINSRIATALADYYTSAQTDSAISTAITTALADHATETWVGEQGYQTATQVSAAISSAIATLTTTGNVSGSSGTTDPDNADVDTSIFQIYVNTSNGSIWTAAGSETEWTQAASGGGGGGSGSLAVQDDGTEIDASADHLNFSGNGVDVSQDGDGVEVAIPKDVIDASDAFPTVDDADDADKYENKAIALRDGGAFRLESERHGSQAHQAISNWTAYTDEDYLGARNSQPAAVASNLDKYFYHKGKRIWERLYNISPAVSGYRWATVTVQTAANDSNIVWIGHKTSQQAAANAITNFDNTKTYLAYFAGRVNQLTNATFTEATGSTLTTVWNWDSIFAHLDLDIQAWTAIHTFHAGQIVYVTNKGFARSKVDNNLNNNPITDDGTNWEVFWGIATQDDGTVIDGAAEHLNFTGTGVVVSQDGNGVEVAITSSGAQGEPGDDAIIRKFLYRNFNAGFTPGLPTGGTYTFATEAYSNLPANWLETPVAPTSGQRQWSIFTEIDPNTTDATATLTWQGIIQRSAGNGTDGGDGADGRFPIFLYQNKSGAAPTTPTNITYTFADDTLGNLGDWSETRTAPGTNETTYQIIATVDPDTTDASVTLTFNTPVPLLTSATLNIDAAQRAESVEFQASASVTGTANSAALALSAGTPVSVLHGSGNAVLLSGTGGESTFTVLKAGTYLGIWDGGIDVDTVRPIPVLELYNNGDTFGTDEEVAYLVGRYRRAGTDNQRFKAVGEVIIPADNTVLQASVTSLSTFSTAPVFNSRAGSRLTLIRMGSEGGDVAVQDDGTQIVAAAEHLNFTGAGVTVTTDGNGASIAIPGGGGDGIGYQYHADRTIVTSTPLTNTTNLYLAQDSGDIYDIELVEHTDLPTDFLENLQEFTPIRLSATGKSWTGHITVMEDVSESGAEFKVDFESRTGTFEAGDSVRISFGASPANIGIETDGVTTKGDGRHSDPVALNTPNDLGASDDGKLLQYNHTNRDLRPVSLTTRGQEIARTDNITRTGALTDYSFTLHANAPSGFSLPTTDLEALAIPKEEPFKNVNGLWVVLYEGGTDEEDIEDKSFIPWGPGVLTDTGFTNSDTELVMANNMHAVNIRFRTENNENPGLRIAAAQEIADSQNVTVRIYLAGVFLE